eukprot:6863890-Prymnesium_polylepis.2
MKATEFDFRFVRTGTTTDLSPPRGPLAITFFDVDGDRHGGDGSIYELVAIAGAPNSTVTASVASNASTLERGLLNDKTSYAIASDAVNAESDFGADPSTPTADTLAASVAFEIEDATHFTVLLGGRAKAVPQSDRAGVHIRPSAVGACPDAARARHT